MTAKLDIVLSVNGRNYEVRVEPRRTLVDTLRDQCGLTGTNLAASMVFAGHAPSLSMASLCVRA